jgi:hypothetical protein
MNDTPVRRRNSRTRQDFVRHITRCWQAGVKNIIDTGCWLWAAKDELPHGEWGKIFDNGELPFSQRTASMLMKIANDPVLSNSKYISNLPPAWSVLYQLTRLETHQLEQLLAEGRITPDLAFADAKRLGQQYQEECLRLDGLAQHLQWLIDFREQWGQAIKGVARRLMYVPEVDNDQLLTLSQWIGKLHAAGQPHWQEALRRRDEPTEQREASSREWRRQTDARHQRARARLKAEFAHINIERFERTETEIGNLTINLTDRGEDSIWVYRRGSDGEVKTAGRIRMTEHGRWEIAQCYLGGSFASIKEAVRAIEDTLPPERGDR